MANNTPRLNDNQKEEYVNDHLFNELRWLLGAATEWSVQDQLKLDVVGCNVQVYAMDSAFVHARALFEFFLKKTSANYYGWDQFLNAELRSVSYDDWCGPLHAHLMHAQDRSRPRKLKSPDGPKDLNQMPVRFANEILRLWKEFEDKLGGSNRTEDHKLQKLAGEKRKEAIEKAQCVVNSEIAQKYAKDKQIVLNPVFGV